MAWRNSDVTISRSGESISALGRERSLGPPAPPSIAVNRMGDRIEGSRWNSEGIVYRLPGSAKPEPPLIQIMAAPARPADHRNAATQRPMVTLMSLDYISA